MPSSIRKLEQGTILRGDPCASSLEAGPGRDAGIRSISPDQRVPRRQGWGRGALRMSEV